MIPRRNVVIGGIVGSVLGTLDEARAEGAPAAAASADVTDETLARIAQAITGLKSEVEGLKSFSEIASVRDVQVTFLRSNGKFPDYIDVGTSIWFGVHDWHVRWQQPLSIGRDNLGRYTVALNQTQLILRPDAVPAFIGAPYDNR